MFKLKMTRLVSMASAAACVASCLSFSSVINITDTDAAEVKDAFTITEEMGLGWNLGNSLDAYNGTVETMGLESEICWGNPYTTKEMIDTVKAKGFTTVRVPTTWFQHVDKNNNFKIDADYLARVKEVVDYCYNNGMYVILNMHHEEGWQNSGTLGSDYERIKPFVTSVWSQIAETFKDYDQHLVFETMNEPRASGTPHEWWGPEQSEIDTINKLNADILGVIRSTESPYKDTRLVMMPSYCASSDMTIMSKTIIPDDDFAAASVHAYTPYNFAMNAEIADHSTFTEAYKNEIISVMDGVRKTFSDKDIPVVLGEFSSSNFENTEARCEWAECYITTVKEYGFPCVLWDNNVEGNNEGEAHGYLNRKDCTWFAVSEPVVDTLVKTMNDSSIKWGSKRKTPTISHDDISTGKIIDKGTHEIDSSVKDGNCSPAVMIKWADIEGKDIAVKFKGEAPVIAFMDSNWKNWTEVKPYDIDEKNGIAYYSSSHVSAAWGEDKLSELSSILTRTNSVTTIETIAIIGASEVVDQPIEPEVVMETVDLSKTDRKSLSFTITGKAGSTTNGCIGYMNGEDWEMIEWDGVIGADGKLVLDINISAIPATVKDAQVQIWWCDDKDAKLSINSGGSEGTTTATTTAATTTEATTTTAVATETTVTTGAGGEEGYKAGDANGDGAVNIADATAIIQFIANPDKYGLTEIQKKNADVDGVSGITPLDAYIIQQIESGKYTPEDLPLKVS